MNFKLLKPGFTGLLATALLVGFSTNISAANDQEISAEVRKEVERLLTDQKFMAPIIERGINNFIMKQQAMAEARNSRHEQPK